MNKDAHPGDVDRARSRRTPLQAQKARKEKARAKAAREEANERNIGRVAEFEHGDMVEEELDAVTPRAPPLFTPKPTQKRRYSERTPLPAPAMELAETSDSEDKASSFIQPVSETEEESAHSAVEESEPTPIKKKEVAKKDVKKKEAGKKGVSGSAPKVDSKVMPFSFW